MRLHAKGVKERVCKCASPRACVCVFVDGDRALQDRDTDALTQTHSHTHSHTDIHSRTFKILVTCSEQFKGLGFDFRN